MVLGIDSVPSLVFSFYIVGIRQDLYFIFFPTVLKNIRVEMIVFRLSNYWIIFVSQLNIIISLSFESESGFLTCLVKFCICYTELDILFRIWRNL